MPPVKEISGPDLGIQVYNIGRPYQPGDILRGRVIRRTAPSVSPMITVAIVLSGRVKTKIEITRGNYYGTYTTSYRSRFYLFDGVGERLYAGPLHIPLEGPAQIWEFAIQIPLNPSPRAVLKEHAATFGKSCFQSLDPRVIRSTRLPASFASSGSHWQNISGFESYVEYHLEASLKQQSKHGISSRALCPIQIQHFSTHRLSFFQLHRQLHPGSVTTYRLAPGLQDAHLSFKEKTHQLFKTSHVPRLSFFLEVDLPKIIQLGNALPFPFRVRIVPSRRHTSQCVLADKSPPFKCFIKALELVLNAQTEVIAPGAFDNYSSEDKVKHQVIVFRGKPFCPSTSTHFFRVKDKERIGLPPEYPKDMITYKGLHEKDKKGCDIDNVTEDSPCKILDPFDMECATITMDKETKGSVIQPILSRTAGFDGFTGSGEAFWPSVGPGEHPVSWLASEKQYLSVQDKQDTSILFEEQNYSQTKTESRSLAGDTAQSNSTRNESKPASLFTDEDRREQWDKRLTPAVGLGDKSETFSYDVKISRSLDEEKGCAPSKTRMDGATGQYPSQGLLVIPIEWNDEENEFIDLGALFDVRIQRHGFIGCNKSGKGSGTIYPSFTTWSIKHSHTFKYKMTVEICGKKMKFTGESDVTVISPAMS